MSSLALIAIIGQIYAALHPGYLNIILQPDPLIGWKFASNIEFIHTGNHWYANEGSVRHKTNSLGFLGPERTPAKQADTGRVALMGDSFVEALQVPWEKTVAGLFERELNRLGASGSLPFKRYEVLNFAISNLSVGQYLLIWEEYASRFSPDYVFIFIAQEPLKRTIAKKADWGIAMSNPSFELVKGQLIRHPVKDYDQTREVFRQQIERQGGRTVKRKQKIWILDWIQSGDAYRLVKGLLPQQIRLSLKQLVVGNNTLKSFFPALKERIQTLLKGEHAKVRPEDSAKVQSPLSTLTMEISEEVLQVNLRVIEELNHQVSQAGGKLVVVDSSLYFWFQGANEILTKRIYRFCQEKQMAYIPLYEVLLETDRNNIWARFPHSHHLNEHGHAIFGKQVLRWIKENVSLPKA